MKSRINELKNNETDIYIDKLTRNEAIYLILNSTIPYVYQILEAFNVTDNEIKEADENL